MQHSSDSVTTTNDARTRAGTRAATTLLGSSAVLARVTEPRRLGRRSARRGRERIMAFYSLKKALIPAIGLVQPSPTGPRAVPRSSCSQPGPTALACENLMLAFRATCYDTCAMEATDGVRIRKFVGLGHDAIVTMVIGVGLRRRGGFYGPRIRPCRERFIKTV
jgi:nitroreductase